MILTNQLLNFGFSIVATFTNAVHVPAIAVPTCIEDLKSYRVGDPGRPLTFYIEHKKLDTFMIENGAVRMYSTPGDYLRLQDQFGIPQFYGKAILNSNQVVELATRTVEKLVVTTNPIAGIVPKVEMAGKAGKHEGHEIPIYFFSWPKPYYRPGFPYFALVEVDARTGYITRLELHDPGFCNFPLAQEISNKAYFPKPLPPPAPINPLPRPKPLKRFDPCPTTNAARQAISSWVWLSDKLRFDPGGQTNLSDVNWDRSATYRSPVLSGAPKICAIELNNGTSVVLDVAHGVTYGYVSGDAYFFGNWPARTDAEIRAFEGPVRHHWEELAADFERRLVERAGVPRELLQPLTARMSVNGAAEFGSTGFKRVLVEWVAKRTKDVAFSVEFDLESGEIKQVAIRHPETLQVLRLAQRASTNLSAKKSSP